MKKSTKITLITISIIIAVLVVAIGGFFIYVNDDYDADSIALDALNSSDVVAVSYNFEGDFYSFEPIVGYTRALVFIPGGKVEVEAYAPLMHKIASTGILCILLKVKYNLAVFDKNAPSGIQEYYKDVDAWVIGGHSLGGVCSAYYISKHSDEYKGIVFLGSFPGEDLTELNASALLLYGSQDKVMNRDKFEKAKSKLPNDYSIIEIGGANHAQFGSYGPQAKDGIATITPMDQWLITSGYVSAFIFAL